MKLPIVFMVALAAPSALALAQSPPVALSESVAPGNGGSMPAGGLSAAEVVGKYLLDSNGVWLGRIQGVTPDGSTASVITPGGQRTTVAMERLGLGNGPNTVIEAGNSDADKLNRSEASIGGP
ncbi:MAG TPA: hypothetical protein VKS60_08355 [Stellaceae bacterium]|nr:hypothetical protein [Stellaceae bacterium]